MGLVVEEAKRFATNVVEPMRVNGLDYTHHAQDIESWANENMWNGDWDLTISFDEGLPGPAVRDLRFIEETEYDQHMEDEDKPEDEIGYVDGYYVFYVD